MNNLNAHLTLGNFRTLWANSSRSSSFSYEALELIYDYFSELETDMSDIVAIDCEVVEQDAEDIAADYGIDISDCDDDDEILSEVTDYISDRSCVIGEVGNSVVFFQF